MNYLDVPNSFVKDSMNRTFAYRDINNNKKETILLLTHLAATMDNWDYELIDGLSKKYRVIVFDGQGIGLSGGATPKNIKEMAKDVKAFIDSLKLNKINILGFSMGGMIAQDFVIMYPDIVDKLILAGTGPRGGKGITNVTRVSNMATLKAMFTLKDPKYYLFFPNNKNSHFKANQYLKRLSFRKHNKDKKMNLKSYINQLKAIKQFGNSKKVDLNSIKQKTLIVNGDNDIMVDSSNSYELAQSIPNSQLIIYKNAGHGSIFQKPEEFVNSVLRFLNDELILR